MCTHILQRAEAQESGGLSVSGADGQEAFQSGEHSRLARRWIQVGGNSGAFAEVHGVLPCAFFKERRAHLPGCAQAASGAISREEPLHTHGGSRWCAEVNPQAPVEEGVRRFIRLAEGWPLKSQGHGVPLDQGAAHCAPVRRVHQR